MHIIIRSSILALIITVLITPYADSHEHCHVFGIETVTHSHLGGPIAYHCNEDCDCGVHDTDDYPHCDELHGHFSHHEHDGPIESSKNVISHPEWHCEGKHTHFHFLDNLIPGDTIRENFDENSEYIFYAVICNPASGPGFESAIQYLKKSDLSSSSNHIKWYILSSTDLPPPFF
ncbi:hypothetical protein [Maridesulfovibrio sp.]|uniref:hypothetical protein n=1 Tax=Maridesulfovibrio sp. TaxID=2795000 RepID=UPI003BA8F585